jgi:hypothetical protein
MSNKIELPDFDDMFALAEEISKLSYEKLVLDAELEIRGAQIAVEATNNEKYFKGGKPPSMEFVKNSYMITGFDGELISVRKRLAEVVSQLELLKNKLQIYRDMISIYQTQSANERASLVV